MSQSSDVDADHGRRTFSNVSEHDLYGPLVQRPHQDREPDRRLPAPGRFGGTNLLTLTYRQGLDIFGASHFDDDLLSRDGAASEILGAEFLVHALPDPQRRLVAQAAAASQTASRPLFISQQFYLGGLAFGRGYGAAEISGDNGLAGSLELRFDQKLNFRYWTGYQLYAFGDAGAVWNDGYRLATACR